MQLFYDVFMHYILIIYRQWVMLIDVLGMFLLKSIFLHTGKYIFMLTWIHVITNESFSWKIANEKTLFHLQEYMLIQHNCPFTHSSTRVKYVHRARKNTKEHSFWRLSRLLVIFHLIYYNFHSRKLRYTETITGNS